MRNLKKQSVYLVIINVRHILFSPFECVSRCNIVCDFVNSVCFVVVFGENGGAEQHLFDFHLKIAIFRANVSNNVQNCFVSHNFVRNFCAHQNILLVLSDTCNVTGPNFQAQIWYWNLFIKTKRIFFKCSDIQIEIEIYF